ncbi:RIP metalloprotease [Chloroflexota bacterium]
MKLLEFILGLAALIFLHELGHFVAARLLKVEVEEFGIGFPPRLVKLFEFKGTEYTLNWLPLGGFVRLKGENDPEVEGGFSSASPWARLGILVAGPLTNLVVGIALAISFFYLSGEPVEYSVYVTDIAPGSPAEAAGLQSGDIFVSINGQKIDYGQTLVTLIGQNLEKSVDLLMQRGDDTYSVSLVPRAEHPENEGAMGVVLDSQYQSISLMAAADTGIKATSEYIYQVFSLPVRILRGQASPSEGRLVGYKGMYDIYQLLPTLWFFAIISTGLGVMNILPIPALDGGRIALTLPEIIIRRRIPAKYETAIHLVGFATLLLLLLYINIQDFVNPAILP